MIGHPRRLRRRLCWAVAMLCSSRASRELGAFPTLAWVMAVGFVSSCRSSSWRAPCPSGSETSWLFVAGAGNIIGLLFEYTAVRSGKVGVVAAIASTEGAVAADPLRVRGRADLGGRRGHPRGDRHGDRAGLPRADGR